MNQLQTKLKEIGACEDAIEWAKDYEDLQTAWDNCKRSDWMIWLINNQEWGNDKQLRLMAVEFARQVQHLMKDERSIKVLDVAEKYANGEATDEDLAAAWAAARDAARAAVGDAAGDAAGAAARAAARAAAWAAARDTARAAVGDAAGDAARAAAWAAARAAAWAAARDAARAKQSDIIRKWIPKVEFI